MKSRKIFFALVLLSALCILLGCSRQSTLPATSSNIPKFTFTKSQSATPQVQISQTLAPTRTPSLTPTVTWTPLPTLSAEEARKTIGELLSNNGGCQIPCWWGITPNQTTLQEVLHLLSPFSEIKQGESGTFIENGETHITTNYTVTYSIPNTKMVGRTLLGIQDSLIISLNVYSPGNEHNFRLHQMLKLFEKPNQVYMSAQPYTQMNILPPAIVILDYSNVGVIASYEFPVYQVGENLRICPKSIGARLELWDPQTKYPYEPSIEEYVSMVTGFDPKKLEDVSNMSIDSFYKTFQNANTSACIETPINLWP